MTTPTPLAAEFPFTLSEEQVLATRALLKECYDGFDELWTLAHVAGARNEMPACVCCDTMLDMLAAQSLRTASRMSEAFSDLHAIIEGYPGGELFELVMRKLLQPRDGGRADG